VILDLAATIPGANVDAFAPVRILDTRSEDDPPRPCGVSEVARDLGFVVTSETSFTCVGDWALVGLGGLGDNSFIAWRFEGTWTVYTAFPSVLCRKDVLEDGMPLAIADLVLWQVCGNNIMPTGPAPVLVNYPIDWVNAVIDVSNGDSRSFLNYLTPYRNVRDDLRVLTQQSLVRAGPCQPPSFESQSQVCLVRRGDGTLWEIPFVAGSAGEQLGSPVRVN
jgi:hypothetical protein